MDFDKLYSQFQDPICNLNCGDYCAPYNNRGIPFCCDLTHAVPAAYKEEWEYLQARTILWHEWQAKSDRERENMQEITPPGQILLACLGYDQCQREYRTITCRAFPFFPYITLDGDFIGLSYYWQYEDQCWVISHLRQVTKAYISQYVNTFDKIFAEMPDEKITFRYFSIIMRRSFGRKHRSIPLLHRNGKVYKISPKNGRMRLISVDKLPKHGPYQIANQLPFKEELFSTNKNIPEF